MRKDGVGVDRFSFPAILTGSVGSFGFGLGNGDSWTRFEVGILYGPVVDTGWFECMRLAGSNGGSLGVRSKYCQSGLFDKVFVLYEEMKYSDIKPDRYDTFDHSFRMWPS
ncbi:hypothetical protein F8388_024506 [Cannabis sativa]|uniref:Uncharacterized protein n=1 Tax=Cannabis sativa TaxID=3483 RepID=A0A7J6DZS7_CANSA|nr:hypothetical protein F8388_024506 [Cannabis sativa]